MEILEMRNEEVDRLKVIRNVLDKKLKWREASEQLLLSIRQIGRLCARVRRESNRGIIHRLRGKPSNHQIEPGLLEKALELVKEKYWDFGPTFANEKLKVIHKIDISTSTLRKGMIESGIWRSKRERPKHRAWRERKSCFGELVQVDGSVHPWFEDRAPECVLIAYIDDATSRVGYAEFVESEDTLTLMRGTKRYLWTYGRPLAFYVDKDSIYKVNRQATIEEDLRDVQPMTQFSRAMEELGIGIIFAGSPQAKGRVERLFGTLQDRLIKELRLAGICTIKEANTFLWERFLLAHNRKFEAPPANPTDVHRPLLKSHALDEILSIRSQRTLGNDFTVKFQCKLFQVLKNQPVRVRPKDKIDVEIRLDGSTHLKFRGSYLNSKIINHRIQKPLYVVKKESMEDLRKPYSPAKNHPWKRFKFGKPQAMPINIQSATGY